MAGRFAATRRDLNDCVATDQDAVWVHVHDATVRGVGIIARLPYQAQGGLVTNFV